jgi:hypothetical protein
MSARTRQAVIFMIIASASVTASVHSYLSSEKKPELTERQNDEVLGTVVTPERSEEKSIEPSPSSEVAFLSSRKINTVAKHVSPSLENLSMIENSERPKEEKPPANKKVIFSVWAGLGAAYFNFNQKSSVATESGDFSDLPFPITSFGGSAGWGENACINFQFHAQTIKIETQSTTAIDKKEFSQKSLSVDFQYAFSQNENKKYSFLLGVQNHHNPFLSTDTNNDVVNVLDNELTTASVGLKANYLVTSNYDYEIFIRYQTLMSAKSSSGYAFKVTPNLIFDGSLGVNRHFSSGLKAGLFWYGQFQDYKYDFTRDGSTSSGSQHFLNSNIEFRIGWEFL